MATLREQAKTSIPRVLRNSLSHGNNSLDAEREQLEREQLNAVTKALSVVECPVKEKHVRTIIIGTFKQKTSQSFWNLVSSKAPLHGNPIVCWKFLHILHKMLREGHPRVVAESIRHKGLIEDLGKLWGHLKEGFGLLISLYCKLLVVKMDFHQRNPDFPGNLAVDKETLVKIGNNDAGNFYELCIEFLDYMDEILSLEKGVFSSLDVSKSNSMTASGQCRLAPLIVCIQDSVHLYDYTVKLLFLLHQHLPPDTLAGHTNRFHVQFTRLRKFYLSSTNLQYFKHLVQVPSLPDSPPNFLVASELSHHVTPVAVVPDLVEEVDDSASEISAVPLVDERERYIDQLLAELESLQMRVTQLEDTKQQQELQLRAAEDRIREEQSLQDRLKADIGSNQAQIAALTAMVQEAQQVQSATAERDDKSKTMEDKFTKLKELYQKLREEHINLLRHKADVDKKLAGSEISKNDAIKSKEIMEKKVEEFLGQITAMKETVSLAESEQSKQIHNLQATNISLTSKLGDAENELRQKDETVTTLEKQLFDRDVELTQMKLRSSDADQNKHNLEYEIVELTAQNRELKCTNEGNSGIIQELKEQIENKNELIAAKNAALKDLAERKERESQSSIQAGLGVLEGVKTLEDIESVTCSGYSLIDLCSRMSGEGVDWKNPVLVGHYGALVWGLGKGVGNTCPDMDIGYRLSQATDGMVKECREFIEVPGGTNERVKEALNEVQQAANNVLKSLGKETDLAELVAQEISAMDIAIEEAAKKIEELLEASRKKDSGAKLEVNEAVLDSCTALVKAIKELVNKSKQLQKEIIHERGAGVSDREFYKKNSRWTEGLISAAKAVGLGAKLLVDAADRVVLGSGKFEEIMVASQEIAGSTAQLVIASRVKAKEGSNKFHELKLASKVVTEATGAVVAVAKSSSVAVENVDLDFSGLSAHQTKTLEMNTQVRLLTLESEVEAERAKLAQLRRQHYKTGADGVEEQ